MADPRTHRHPAQTTGHEPHAAPRSRSRAHARPRAGAELLSSSSSSSSSSSYLDISRNRPFGSLGNFFFAPREPRRRVRRRRSTARLSSSSSSSLNTDLAYGTGFLRVLKRRRSQRALRRDGRRSAASTREERKGERKRRDEGRRGPDAEILAIGAGLAKLARDKPDAKGLGERRRAETVVVEPPSGAGQHATSYIVEAEQSHYGRPSRDDDGWESASGSDSESSADSKLAFGEGGGIASILGWGKQSRKSNSTKSHVVDPRLFGRQNSLHGFVSEPVGAGYAPRTDGVLGEASSYYSPSMQSGPPASATLEQTYATAVPARALYSVSPRPIVAEPDPIITSKLESTDLQHPQPIAPVSQSVYIVNDFPPAARVSEEEKPRRTSGMSVAGLALAGMGAAAVGSAVGSSRGEDPSRRRSSPEPESRDQRDDRDRDVAEKYRKPSKSSAPDSDQEGSTERRRRRERREKRDDEDRVSDHEREKKREKRKRGSRDETKEERRERRERQREERRSEVAERPRDAHDTRQTRSEVGDKRSSVPVDPFQYQVADDAFPSPAFEIRPGEAPFGRPHIINVDRTPDFANISDDAPKEAMRDGGRRGRYRSDSYDREPEPPSRNAQQNAADLYEEIEHSTAPIAAGAIGAAVAAIAAQEARQSRSYERRNERRNDAPDPDERQKISKRSKDCDKDRVQEEADRAYRETVMARKIASQVIRSRSASPEHSIVDKYQDEQQEDDYKIVTPPGMEDQKKKNSPYDAPNADFRPDHVIDNPRDLSTFRISVSDTSATGTGLPAKFDPDASRPRPFLNLVLPTPVPSPAPDRLVKTDETREAKPTAEPTGQSESQGRKHEDQPKSANAGTASSVPGSINDSVVSDSPSSKNVTWGPSQTKHYEVDSASDGRENSPEAVTKHGPGAADSPKSKPAKRSGWGAIAAGIMGTAMADKIAPVHDSQEQTRSSADTLQHQDGLGDDDDEDVEEIVMTSAIQDDRDMRRNGGFEDDLDFAAVLAAGLQETGFDPEIVIEDSTYRRRTSPPATGFESYQQPFAETVSDLAYDRGQSAPRDDRHGYIIGEVPETPKEWKSASPILGSAGSPVITGPNQSRDEQVTSVDAEPALEDESYFGLPKLSKKEQKKRDKAQKQASLEASLREAEEQKATPETLVEEPESYFETPKKSKKKNKKGSSAQPDVDSPIADGRIAVPVDTFQDVQAAEEERQSKKSKKKSKRDSGILESPAQSEAPTELSRSGSKKSKDKSRRRSEQYDEFYDASATTPESGPPGQHDAGQVEEAEMRKSKKKSRSSTKDDFDDTRSVVSAPPSTETDAKKKGKEKRSSGLWGLFTSSKSDVGAQDESRTSTQDDFEEPKKKGKKSKRHSSGDRVNSNDTPDQDPASDPDVDSDRPAHRAQDRAENVPPRPDDPASKATTSDSESFLDDAGILGAGVGLAAAATALIAAGPRRSSKATIHEDAASRDASDPASERDSGSDVAAHIFRPSIDPRYGDLLPLPPSPPARSRSEGQDDLGDLPALPESRPETPEAERFAQRERDQHVRASSRRSIHETPAKSPSFSAVPLKFMLGNRSTPASPIAARSSPMTSPSPAPAPSGPDSPTMLHRRSMRPTSWDSAREYKPLYLVENNRRAVPTQHPVDEEDVPLLPPLPPSTRSSSLSSQFESAYGGSVRAESEKGESDAGFTPEDVHATTAMPGSEVSGAGRDADLRLSMGYASSVASTSDVFHDFGDVVEPDFDDALSDTTIRGVASSPQSPARVGQMESDADFATLEMTDTLSGKPKESIGPEETADLVQDVPVDDVREVDGSRRSKADPSLISTEQGHPGLDHDSPTSSLDVQEHAFPASDGSVAELHETTGPIAAPRPRVTDEEAQDEADLLERQDADPAPPSLMHGASTMTLVDAIHDQGSGDEKNHEREPIGVDSSRPARETPARGELDEEDLASTRGLTDFQQVTEDDDKNAHAASPSTGYDVAENHRDNSGVHEISPFSTRAVESSSDFDEVVSGSGEQREALLEEAAVSARIASTTDHIGNAASGAIDERTAVDEDAIEVAPEPDHQHSNETVRVAIQEDPEKVKPELAKVDNDTQRIAIPEDVEKVELELAKVDDDFQFKVDDDIPFTVKSKKDKKKDKKAKTKTAKSKSTSSNHNEAPLQAADSLSTIQNPTIDQPPDSMSGLIAGPDAGQSLSQTGPDPFDEIRENLENTTITTTTTAVAPTTIQPDAGEDVGDWSVTTKKSKKKDKKRKKQIAFIDWEGGDENLDGGPVASSSLDTSSVALPARDGSTEQAAREPGSTDELGDAPTLPIARDPEDETTKRLSEHITDATDLRDEQVAPEGPLLTASRDEVIDATDFRDEHVEPEAPLLTASLDEVIAPEPPLHGSIDPPPESIPLPQSPVQDDTASPQERDARGSPSVERFETDITIPTFVLEQKPVTTQEIIEAEKVDEDQPDDAGVSKVFETESPRPQDRLAAEDNAAETLAPPTADIMAPAEDSLRGNIEFFTATETIGGDGSSTKKKHKKSKSSSASRSLTPIESPAEPSTFNPLKTVAVPLDPISAALEEIARKPKKNKKNRRSLLAESAVPERAVSPDREVQKLTEDDQVPGDDSQRGRAVEQQTTTSERHTSPPHVSEDATSTPISAPLPDLATEDQDDGHEARESSPIVESEVSASSRPRYNDDQLSLARQLQEEFSKKPSKKDKKKRQSLPSTPSTESVESRSVAFADDAPRSRSLSNGPPSESRSGFSQEQLELAKQMQADFDSGAMRSKKEKKKSKKRSGLSRSSTVDDFDINDELMKTSDPDPELTISSPAALEVVVNDDAPIDTSAFDADQISSAHQLQADFASGALKTSKEKKKSKKRSGLSRSSTVDDFNINDELTTTSDPDPELRLSSPATPEVVNDDGRTNTSAFDAEQMSYARQLQADFASGTLKTSKEKKKSKKKSSLSRSSTADNVDESIASVATADPVDDEPQLATAISEKAVLDDLPADEAPHDEDLPTPAPVEEEDEFSSFVVKKKKDKKCKTRAGVSRSSTLDESEGLATSDSLTFSVAPSTSTDLPAVEDVEISPLPKPETDADSLEFEAGSSKKSKKDKKKRRAAQLLGRDISLEAPREDGEATNSLESSIVLEDTRPASDLVDDAGFAPVKKSKKDKKRDKSSRTNSARASVSWEDEVQIDHAVNEAANSSTGLEPDVPPASSPPQATAASQRRMHAEYDLETLTERMVEDTTPLATDDQGYFDPGLERELAQPVSEISAAPVARAGMHETEPALESDGTRSSAIGADMHAEDTAGDRMSEEAAPIVGSEPSQQGMSPEDVENPSVGAAASTSEGLQEVRETADEEFPEFIVTKKRSKKGKKGKFTEAIIDETPSLRHDDDAQETVETPTNPVEVTSKDETASTTNVELDDGFTMSTKSKKKDKKGKRRDSLFTTTSSGPPSEPSEVTTAPLSSAAGSSSLQSTEATPEGDLVDLEASLMLTSSGSKKSKKDRKNKKRASTSGHDPSISVDESLPDNIPLTSEDVGTPRAMPFESSGAVVEGEALGKDHQGTPRTTGEPPEHGRQGYEATLPEAAPETHDADELARHDFDPPTPKDESAVVDTKQSSAPSQISTRAPSIIASSIGTTSDVRPMDFLSAFAETNMILAETRGLLKDAETGSPRAIAGSEAAAVSVAPSEAADDQDWHEAEEPSSKSLDAADVAEEPLLLQKSREDVSEEPLPSVPSDSMIVGISKPIEREETFQEPIAASLKPVSRKLSKKQKRKQSIDKRAPSNDMFDDPELWEESKPRPFAGGPEPDADGDDGLGMWTNTGTEDDQRSLHDERPEEDDRGAWAAQTEVPTSTIQHAEEDARQRFHEHDDGPTIVASSRSSDGDIGDIEQVERGHSNHDDENDGISSVRDVVDIDNENARPQTPRSTSPTMDTRSGMPTAYDNEYRPSDVMPVVEPIISAPLEDVHTPYGRDSPSILSVVEEEPESSPEIAIKDEDRNRDSAFVTGSPTPAHSRLHTPQREQLRDSAVHMPDESPTVRLGSPVTDAVLASLEWPTVDDVHETIDLRQSPHERHREERAASRLGSSPRSHASFRSSPSPRNSSLPVHGEIAQTIHAHREGSISPAQASRSRDHSHMPSSPPKHVNVVKQRVQGIESMHEHYEKIKHAKEAYHEEEPSKKRHHMRDVPAPSPGPLTPTNLSFAGRRASLEGRPDSAQSHRSYSYGPNIQRLRTPDIRATPIRPDSANSSHVSSARSGTPPLRRSDRKLSGDLRSLSQRTSRAELTSPHEERSTKAAVAASAIVVAGVATGAAVAAASKDDKHDKHDGSNSTGSTVSANPIANEGRVRAKDMADVYVSCQPACDWQTDAQADHDQQDGFGEGRIGSPRSPTRPHSMRRRQSMQVLDLEARIEHLIAENRALAEARSLAEQHLRSVQHMPATLANKETELATLQKTIEWMKGEVSRLTEVNDGLSSANVTLGRQQEERYAILENQYADTLRELEEEKGTTNHLSTDMASMIEAQVAATIIEKDRQIAQLVQDLDATKTQIRSMQQQILASRSSDGEFLTLRDEDYFDTACQALCQHVQQWVLRFSKFSDMRACRLTSEINNDKIIDRLDNAILDGSDVDSYLSDRVRRRDVFMSMTMTMIWEFIFTRYLFGMDRDQRQKLKSLEKLLTEVGPPAAVHSWRATTLTLLSRRPAFAKQRDQDTVAVVNAILETLTEILPPPSHLESQIETQLTKVIRSAVELSIEMRTQKAEYMMLPPLQPEYDANGDLASKVTFNAALMNERSGGTSNNEDLETNQEVVRLVLFPLVVRREEGEEVVVCPAQVLVASAAARRDKGKGRAVSAEADVDMLSTAESARSYGAANRSRASLHSVMLGAPGEGENMI